MMGLKSMCVEKYRKVLPASHGITQQPASQGSGSHRKLLLRVLPKWLGGQPAIQAASHGTTQQPASHGSVSHRTLLLRMLPNGSEVLLTFPRVSNVECRLVTLAKQSFVSRTDVTHGVCRFLSICGEGEKNEVLGQPQKQEKSTRGAPKALKKPPDKQRMDGPVARGVTALASRD